MIELKELQHQLKLSDKEIEMVLGTMWIKPVDGEISIHDSKRITDWAVGYREFPLAGE